MKFCFYSPETLVFNLMGWVGVVHVAVISSSVSASSLVINARFEILLVKMKLATLVLHRVPSSYWCERHGL